MATFFTADPHFGHANVIKHCNRPFADLETMHEELITRWNSKVSDGDIVWVLGDFSLHPRELVVLSELNGRKRLISGNHDSVWSGHSQSHKHFRTYLDAGFETIDSFRKLKIVGLTVNLSHFPYGEGRYAPYRLIDDGTILLHGHVHELWKYRTSSKGTPMINVGVDVWDFAPVSLGEVTTLFDEHQRLC